MQGWLTPDLTLFSNPPEARVISVPGDLWYLVSGALGELTDVDRWEQFGSATPYEAAEYFAQVYEDFLVTSPFYIGEMRPFAIATLPSDWLPFDGNSRLVADFPELAAVIPASWVSGANFTLPLMAGMAPVGEGTHTTHNFVRGATGGERTHTLTIAEIPPHNHPFNNWGISLTGATGAVNKPNITPTANSTSNTGGGAAHENMQPYLVVRWAIYAGA